MGRMQTLATLLPDARRTRPIRLLLDYDGTLVPITSTPELAAPDEDVLTLLGKLASTPGLRLDLVSGRVRSALEDWFGHLPIALWAEHAYWHRLAPGECWRAAQRIPSTGLEHVTPILERFAASTPGSHVETKMASVAWHFRRAEKRRGARQAHRLRMELTEMLRNQPLEVLRGRKVIEVRVRGVSKALVAARVRAESGEGGYIMAIGDDRTDEDLFRALPPSSATVVVGNRPSCARYRAADHREVRRILHSLADQQQHPIGLKNNTRTTLGVRNVQENPRGGRYVTGVS